MAETKPKVPDAGVWRILIPVALSLIVTIIGAAWSLSARMSIMQSSMERMESGFVSKEVVELQLSAIRLEIKLVDLKITQHVQSFRDEGEKK